MKRNWIITKDKVNKEDRLTENSQIWKTGLDGGKVSDWQGRGGDDLSHTKGVTVEGK